MSLINIFIAIAKVIAAHHQRHLMGSRKLSLSVSYKTRITISPHTIHFSYNRDGASLTTQIHISV